MRICDPLARSSNKDKDLQDQILPNVDRKSHSVQDHRSGTTGANASKLLNVPLQNKHLAMRYFVFLGMFLAVGYLHQDKQRPISIPPRERYYLTDKAPLRDVTLTYTPSRDNYIFKKNVKSAKLSDIEITRIKSLIEQKIIKYNKTAVVKIRSPLKYYKQFIAVTNAKGEKEVWINCYCSVMGDDWQKNIATVHDGGPCYFSLKINLSKDRVEKLSINGLA